MTRRAVLLVPLWAAACVVPQDVAEAPDLPEVTNHAPRIVSDTARVEGLPQRRLVVQKNCRSVQFELGVIEDLDASDDLEVRWFVNYDEGETFARQITVIRGGPDVRDGVRSPAGDSFRLVLDRLEVGRSVVVEAWVSDGFDDPAEEPPFRRVLEGRDFDEVAWVIEVQEGVCAL